MISARLIACTALLAALLVAAPAAGQDTGGGVTAPTAPPSASSAPVAPAADPSAAAPEVALPVTPAQAETPTTPEGEQQPPEEQPDGEQTPTEEDGESEPGGGQGGLVAGEPGGGSGGGLPATGFEVAALTSIGLGLLLAGAALWPTSSWPPPRDRLSRSAQRR
jgi:hypothetical protein